MLGRTPLLIAAVSVAVAAGAPSNTAAKSGCAYKYTMHQYIRYANAVLPVPSARDSRELDRIVGCLWLPRLRRVAAAWRRGHELRLGEHVWANSTSYSSCDSGSTTAAGTTATFGEVAQNSLPLGTRIFMDSPVYGRRLFVVLDRIGSGSELDFFAPYCAWADWWGRREVGYRVVR